MDVSLATPQNVQKQIEFHVQKILVTQDADGMIPSSIEFSDRTVEKKKDIPRQAMATMALSFAQTLVPSLSAEDQIALSLRYIREHMAEEPPVNQMYADAYLALARVYGRLDPTEHLTALQEQLSAEFFKHPILIGLYLRLANLVPDALPQAAHSTEVQRYNLSLVPRKHRFFEYADTLVWAKNENFFLAQQEYQFLLGHKTSGGWFQSGAATPATASVVGKMFEVFAYAHQDDMLVERIYCNLMKQTATSAYAKQALGAYAGHIMSEPDTLRVDDAHVHVLMGLCYHYERVSRPDAI